MKPIARRTLIGLLCGIVSSFFLCFTLGNVALGLALGVLLGIVQIFVSLGSVYGLIFCLLAGPRVNTPGGGLLWGLAFALVFWLIGPASIGALFVSASPGSTTMLESARSFPRPGWLHTIFWRSTGHRSWNRKSRVDTRAARGSEVQFVPSHCGRRISGHRGRMGVWPVDGEGKSFPCNRRADSSSLRERWSGVTFCLCLHNRLLFWITFSA